MRAPTARKLGQGTYQVFRARGARFTQWLSARTTASIFGTRHGPKKHIWSKFIIRWILLWALLLVEDLVVAFSLYKIKPRNWINFVFHQCRCIIQDQPFLLGRTILFDSANDCISSRIVDKRVVELDSLSQKIRSFIVSKIKGLRSVVTDCFVPDLESLLFLQFCMFDCLYIGMILIKYRGSLVRAFGSIPNS